MDRFIIREPRVGTEYPQGNQNIFSSTNSVDYNTINNENLYYGGGLYTSEFHNVQTIRNPASYVGVGTHVNSPSFGNSSGTQQGQTMSGIDPRYLAVYSDGNAKFIATGLMQQERPAMPTNSPFGCDYQNHNLVAPNRNKIKMFQPQMYRENPQRPETPMMKDFANNNSKLFKKDVQIQQSAPQKPSNVHSKKIENTGGTKNEHSNFVMSRSDKIKALHKSGMRVFSGPVEKVLKWHKSLQDIGVMVLYEIVAKCVSVRPGESCAKNLVVRDENGPAMQIVYYEIDFLLPELKPPCTIRVIGRMQTGSSRFQALSARPAAGDDVAMLPRRAAVAAHHVAKLCREYGSNVTFD